MFSFFVCSCASWLFLVTISEIGSVLTDCFDVVVSVIFFRKRFLLPNTLCKLTPLIDDEVDFVFD